MEVSKNLVLNTSMWGKFFALQQSLVEVSAVYVYIC